MRSARPLQPGACSSARPRRRPRPHRPNRRDRRSSSRKRALPVGTIITADAIGYQLWPKEMVQDAYFIDGEADMSKLLGTVVRHPITAGEPVTQGSLVAPWRPRLPCRGARPGHARRHRAGFGKDRRRRLHLPGRPCRPDADPDDQRRRRPEPQRCGNDPAQPARARDRPVDRDHDRRRRQDRRPAFRTVTLEATPKIAEKIAVAQTIGTLSLSLRSIADNQSRTRPARSPVANVNVPDGATQGRRGSPAPRCQHDAAGRRADLRHRRRRVALPAQARCPATHAAELCRADAVRTAWHRPGRTVRSSASPAVRARLSNPSARVPASSSDRQAAAMGSAAGPVATGMTVLK